MKAKLPKRREERQGGPLAFRGGTYSLAITAIVLALLVVVNIFASALPTSLSQYDISSSKLYSVTSNTKVVLNELEDDVTLPAALINDGRVLRRQLTACGRDERWLQKTLQQEGLTSPRQVFLLTLDEQGKTVCVKKEEPA